MRVRLTRFPSIKNNRELLPKKIFTALYFAVFFTYRAPQLTGAFAVDCQGSLPDLLILFIKSDEQGPRLCAFVTQVCRFRVFTCSP